MHSDPSFPTDPDESDLEHTTGAVVSDAPGSGDRMEGDDLWAWAHEEPDASEPMLDPGNVVALLIAHNAGGWLSRTLAALSRLDPRPGTTIALDTGSTDHTGDSLRRAQADGLIDRIVRLPADTPFAVAVNSGRDEARAGRGVGPEPADGWLWILHDDCEPTRTALGQLLRIAATTPSPDIVVPALLRPRRRNYPDQLQEGGQTISLTGSRLTGSDPGDIDQHQLESDEVLGGASAGLLVRTEVFDRVGGLDPRLQHREGVDLCWRARDTGARVVTAPRATIHHRQAGLAGTRGGIADPDPEATDRLSGMRLVAVRSRRPRLAVVGLVLLGILRAVGFLLGRAPARALSEWRATRWLAGSRSAVLDLAARRGPSTDDATEKLRPHVMGTLKGAIGDAAAAIGSRVIDWRASDTSIDELTGDDFAGAPQRASFWRPGVVWGLLGLAGAVAAVRLAGGGIVSTHLLPSPGFLSAWDSWWRPTPGVVGAPAPWLWFAAVGSTLTLGHPGLWIWLVLAFSVSVSARGAASLLREVADAPPWLVVALAALWALFLPWLGILQRGDVGALAIVVTAPWLGLALWRWARAETTGPVAWRAPAAVGLIGLLWFSSQPISWLVIVAGVLVVLRVRPHTWRIAVVALLAPLVFAAGWFPRLVEVPARLLATPDPLAAPFAASGGPLALLGLVSRVPALPTVLVLAVGIIVWTDIIVLLGVGAARAGRGDAAAGLIAVASLILGVFLPRIPVSIDGRGLRVDGVAFIALGLGTLMVIGYRLLVRTVTDRVDVDALDADVATVRRGGVRLAIGTATVLSLAIAIGWVVVGDRPAHSAGSVLPSWVTALESSDRAGRTLLIDLGASPVTWQLSDATRPQWGTAEEGGVLSGVGGQDLRDLVVSIASGQPANLLAQHLADAGVVAVWVHADNGVLNGVPGLQSTPENATTTVYAVTGLVSRLRIIDAATSTPIGAGFVQSSTSTRTLVLAEPLDSRWRVRVGGTLLEAAPPAGGWQERFTVPAGVQGPVSWTMAPSVGSAIMQILVLLVLLVLVAPVASPSLTSPRRAGPAGTPRRGHADG